MEQKIVPKSRIFFTWFRATKNTKPISSHHQKESISNIFKNILTFKIIVLWFSLIL
jgi:hypothetical protein